MAVEPLAERDVAAELVGVFAAGEKPIAPYVPRAVQKADSDAVELVG